MSDHAKTQENIDAYLAGGLSANDRAALERHVADCAECTEALAKARALETTMKDLFADAPPDANLEERVILRLRRQPAGYPMWVRYTLAAAAVLVLGFVGAVAQAVATGESPRRLQDVIFKRSAQSQSTNDLKQVGLGFESFHLDGKMRKEDIPYSSELMDDFSVPGPVDEIIKAREGLGNNMISGLRSGGALTPELDLRHGRYSFTPDGSTNALSTELSHNYLERGEEMKKDGGKDEGRRPYNSITGGIVGSNRKPRNGDAATLPTTPQIGGWEPFRGPSKHPTTAHVNIAEAGISKDKLPPRNQDGLAPVSPPAENSPSYFKPANVKPNQTPPPEDVAKSPKRVTESGDDQDKGEKGLAHKMTGLAKKDYVGEVFIVQPEQQPPLDTSRKIIRTGDIDFEIESFDDSYLGVGNLIGAVKGGFIATVNSDKLPNGKMKGAIVVRMPPQFLDKFIADLRGLLTMKGELKGQRIGSSDVTKQYTDVESELRAARAVEERFLRIIKDGKGEIKDLVAAERELGTWRTKIEKLEGEKRYYDNQVALSTLKINLTEKEITAPAALVRNETVQMRLEVDDVKRALENAVSAVDAMQGRVLKSESKQHKAGQFEATLHAEIPAAKKDAFRRELAKLGIVSEDEATQKMQAEGGTGKPGKIVPRINDVVFEVTLNNIVNIPPRHSVKLKVASNEVAASYAKLEAFILTKGQMRISNLSEPDKQRVTAYLEFNVPNQQKDAADKLLAAIGPVLEKKNEQVPVTEIATNQKFGYVVNLYSVATIPAREKIVLSLEVDDVEAKASQIEAFGKASKGQVERGRFVQSQRGDTSTIVAVHAPMGASDALWSQFIKLGKVVGSEKTPNASVPENELATVLIIINLSGGSRIVGSDEGLWVQINNGLYFAFWLLSRGLVFIIIGICGVLPWVIVIWGAVKVFLWMFATPAAKPEVVVAHPAQVKPVEPPPSASM